MIGQFYSYSSNSFHREYIWGTWSSLHIHKTNSFFYLPVIFLTIQKSKAPANIHIIATIIILSLILPTIIYLMGIRVSNCIKIYWILKKFTITDKLCSYTIIAVNLKAMWKKQATGWAEFLKLKVPSSCLPLFKSTAWSCCYGYFCSSCLDAPL